MSTPDLNLLVTLDAVLAEGSVVRAARRLHLSPSAMSRALARVREATGNPLLVRAGRGLVPTPRAAELRERVGHLVAEAEAVLRPAERPRLASVSRTFTMRTGDGFVEAFGAALIVHVRREAPGIRLRFVQKPDKDATPLRDGHVNLETGVVTGPTAPELRTQALFRDRFVGVVRRQHRLRRGVVTRAAYASGQHVHVSRHGTEVGHVDQVLEKASLRRQIVALVGGFAAALALARGTDLIATVPERHTATLRAGMHTFTLPFEIDDLTVSMLWHPRLDADPVHQWLRSCVRDVCGDTQQQR